MLIKIINFRRKEPRLPRDLRRLIRYLLSPKLSAGANGARLLGPPELHHLLLSVRPWGTEISAAAEDITEQFVRYCREATVGQTMPEVWYVHMIFSFAPVASSDLKTPPDPHWHLPRWASQSANAIRIARDALDFLGWIDMQPAIFVVHGDRRHIHVHAVIAIPVFGDKPWNALRLSRRLLNETAKICADAFHLPITARSVEPYYKKWESLLDTSEGHSK